MSYKSDLDKTIKTFEYTRAAIKQRNKVIGLKCFEEGEDEDKAIYNHLMEMAENTISFQNFLKRYIYQGAGIEESFSSVTNDDYMEIILDAFAENGVPFSFKEDSKKTKKETVKGWLAKRDVKRSSIFLMGFGLKMSDNMVEEFLTKYIQEPGFNFYNKDEVIYWYCFRNKLSYLEAKKLLLKYETELPLKLPDRYEVREFEDLWDIRDTSGERERKLLYYLSWLKEHGFTQDKAREIFLDLYQKARAKRAAELTQAEEEEGKKKIYTADMITPVKIEEALYSGEKEIIQDGSGNQKKLKDSDFYRLFSKYHFTRQRMSKLLKGELSVDRYDIMTLNFYLFEGDNNYMEREEKALGFIKSTDALLKECKMYGLYPPNPYDNFLVLCMYSWGPMECYSSVWEQSYK